MTTAIPVLFKPIFMNDNCYIDGGVLNNYPVKDCLENEKCDEREILGIKNQYVCKLNINEDMNLLEYLQNLQGMIVQKLQRENELIITLPYEVKCVCEKNMSNYSEWLSYMTDKDKRLEIIEQGRNYGELFFNYQKQLNVTDES